MQLRKIIPVFGLAIFFVAILSAGLTLAAPLASHAPSATATYVPAVPYPWPMFHRDEAHTGYTITTGRIDMALGPTLRATYRIFDEPAAGDLQYLRWTTTLPLADLDGDGTYEIVVTTPDFSAPLSLTLAGQPLADQVIVLKYLPGQAPPIQQMWSYTASATPGEAGLDTYSPALADADQDGLPDVIFTSRDGYVRALKGTTGALLWQFHTNRRTEAGPTVADLDGNGTPEVIIVTDCASGVACPGVNDRAYLYVLPITGTGTIDALWSIPYPYKLDSAVPAVADIDTQDEQAIEAVIMGTWGGELLVAWRNPDGQVYTATQSLEDLDPTIPPEDIPVIRTSPLVADFGEWPVVVFGWLPTDENAADARLSAIRLNANFAAGTVQFLPRWTRADYDTWKSSPALVPQSTGAPLVVLGYGLGSGPPPTQSGAVGQCDPDYITGGIVAYNYLGNVVWHHDYGGLQGNVRASPAVADFDGDHKREVILPIGCFGQIYIYNGTTGTEMWTHDLGPLAQGSPSLGDLDNDGSVDIVVSSYDGHIYLFSDRFDNYLPLLFRQR